MTDPVNDYMQKHAAFEAATDKVDALVGNVTEMASLLRDWRHIIPPGAPDLPTGIPAARHSINLDRWPTRQEIAHTLSAWHAARLELKTTWRLVPAKQRPSLKRFQARERVLVDPERNAEYKRKYRRANPFANAITHLRRRLPAGAECITPSQCMKLLEFQKFLCAGCGEKKPLRLDHIRPRELGGESTLPNIQLLCEPCNVRKGHKKVIDYRLPEVRAAVERLYTFGGRHTI